jgi:hypothetical protein
MNAAVNALMTMELRDCDAWVRQNGAYFDALLRQASVFPAYVLPDPSAPLVVTGIVHHCGVGECWMLTGKGFGKGRTSEVLRQQRLLCASIYQALGLHRMHILCDAARSEAGRWAGALGFEYEFTAARFGPLGNDMGIWVWPYKERGRA